MNKNNVTADTEGARSSTHHPQNIALNTNKAGMEGLDTEKINEIIQKASEGSKFYIHKQKCQERLNEKILQMKKDLKRFTQEQIDRAEAEMTRIGKEMSQARDLSKTIVHIDMDMFFAAVEMRDDPSLKDKPMAVGSTGMLSTSNYVARKYGVRAAMPGFIALKLCPQLVIVRPNFSKYKDVSREIQEIFKEYDPNFAPMSLDEAYLDITEFVKENKSQYQNDHLNLTASEEVVKEIRARIEAKTHLTASAGIAPNTRLAKVCSDMNKPNGQYYLPPDEEAIMEFVNKLPIRKISGIGGVSEQQLKALGIEACCDLWKKRGLLRLLFSETSYVQFLRISLGLGSTEVEAYTERERKSISNETTFKGTSDSAVLFKFCEDLCQELQDDMERKEVIGRIFTLKLKTIDFQIRTRAHTLLEATCEASIMTQIALKLLQHEMEICTADKPLSLRLLGVRMSNLCHKSEVSPKKQQTITNLFHKCIGDDEAKKLSLVKKKDSCSNKCTLEKTSKNLYKDDFSSYKVWKAKVNGQPHNCPVCCQCLHFPSLSEFNNHVFNCLKIRCENTNPKNISQDPQKAVPSCSDVVASVVHDASALDDLGESAFNTAFLSNSESLDVGGEDFSLANEPEMEHKSELSKSGQDNPESRISNILQNTDFANIHNSKIESKKVATLSDQAEKHTCPVCSNETFSDNLSLNLHLDVCLNGSTIKELVKESNNSVPHMKTQIEMAPNSSKSKCQKRKIPQKARKEKKLKSSSILHKFLGIQ